MAGRALSGSIGITSKLPADQRTALEQLLFFNVNQHRVRVGIQQSIETYGVPEIHEHDGGLSIRVGDIEGVQSLFAVSERAGRWGWRCSCDWPASDSSCCISGCSSHASLAADLNTRVLLKLMHEIRSTARRTHGVDRIELVYRDRPAVRLHG